MQKYPQVKFQEGFTPDKGSSKYPLVKFQDRFTPKRGFQKYPQVKFQDVFTLDEKFAEVSPVIVPGRNNFNKYSYLLIRPGFLTPTWNLKTNKTFSLQSKLTIYSVSGSEFCPIIAGTMP